MKEQRKARGGIRGLIERRFKKKRPVLMLTEDVANAAINCLLASCGNPGASERTCSDSGISTRTRSAEDHQD